MRKLLFCIIVCLVGLGVSIDSVELGKLSFSSSPRVVSYVMDSNPVVLDSGILFSRANALGTSVTNWGGGTIVFTLSPSSSFLNLDRLSCTPSDTSITSEYDASARTLTITAPNTVSFANLQSTLRTVSFSSRGLNTVTRSVAISVRETGSYDSANGHYYLLSSAIGLDTVTGVAASANSGTFTHYGRRGYLVTITDSSENAFVTALSNNVRTWIGASDTVAGGAGGNSFRWLSGPEYGQSISYTNWASSRPNGNSSNDMLEINFNGAGQWNDLDADSSSYKRPYVIEFGGMLSDQVAEVITIKVSGVNSLMLFSPY